MSTITINGPVVPTDTHNQVLRDALFHSPTERSPNSSSYHVIEVGVREGAYTTWVGTWDQSAQRIAAATPTRVLDDGRPGMRLRAGQAVVVRVTTYGTPDSLEGSRINFRLGLVGGRDGPAQPLVAPGVSVADSNSRVSLAALAKQINTGGLSDWDEPVQLQDPVTLVATGTFQGRLQRDSTTQISLQRYGGNWVEVDGAPVSLTSAGLVLTTSDGLLTSSGVISATAPSSSTLYYVYVGSTSGGSNQLRLSATAPTAHLGVYYLGMADATRRWRFAGWARTNGSTQFADDVTDRLVVNYYNRQRKTIALTPAYSDDNTLTSYTTTSTTWTAANGGTGSTGSYIANGEDAIFVSASSTCSNSGASVTLIGVGDNSGANCAVAGLKVGTGSGQCACSYATVPATGYRTIVLLVRVTGGTGTYIVDDVRNGSATDPVMTALYATVMV